MRQINKIEKEFSAIILAAGKSERLGFPKLSLKYDENNTFVEYIVDEYKQFGCKEIILVVNEIGNKYLIDHHISFSKNLIIVINKYPDWHRFYSLKIGVRNLSENRPTFVHNVDNPFVNHQVLNQLSENINEADYLNPEYSQKGGHPFLISEKVVKEITQIKEDQKHLKEFLNQYKRLRIGVDDEKVLTNINTLEEYRKYFDI